MNRLLTVVALLVACGIGLGFYLGWFQIASDSTEGTTHIKLTVDEEKMQEDEKTVEKRMRGIE